MKFRYFLVLSLLCTLCCAVRAASASALNSVSPNFLDDEPTSAPSEGEGPSTEDLAKQTQNPVANLISVPFQSNFNFGIGHNDVTQYVLNVQPVIPITLNEDWNLITRTILPIVNQPSPFAGVSSAFGLGDLNPTFFFAPRKSGEIIWGAGPTFTFPTGTEAQLTSGKFSAGPAAVVLTMQGPWVLGALANQQWSYAGWGPRSLSALLVQPFANYNLPDGWYLSSGPIITANWFAGSERDVWTVPVGGGIGKIVKIDKLPLNLSLQAFDNIIRPTAGPDWQLRFQVQFLFPK
jgi:hypothetical protein